MMREGLLWKVTLLLLCISLAQGRQVFRDRRHFKEVRTTVLDGIAVPFNQSDVDKPDVMANAVTMDSADTTGKGRWLVQVQGPITESWKASMNAHLASQGTRLGTYFPHMSFLVRGSIDDDFHSFLLQGPGVLGVIRYRSSFKIARALAEVFGAQPELPFVLNIQVFGASDGETAGTEIRDGVLHDLQRWILTLSSTQQAAIVPEAVSVSMLLVRILKRPLIARVSQWLATHPDVQWIEEKSKVKATNYYVDRVIQGDDEYNLPLDNRGLRGEGIVVGVVDTGLDHDHCFFTDPNTEVIFNQYNPDHRKVVYYNNLSGDIDWNSHGTHVSGTIAGNCLDPNFPLIAADGGMAPLAKLAFVQVGDIHNGFNPPDNLTMLMDWQRVDGHAMMSSNSWGSTAKGTSYTPDDQRLDAYLWDYPNFLTLFAAANMGIKGLSFEAGAKNIVTVGSSQSFQDRSPETKNEYLTFHPGNYRTTTSLYFSVYPPQLEDIDISQYQNLPVFINLDLGCSTTNLDYTGAAVIVVWTDCVPGGQSDQTYNLQQAGAKLVIMVLDQYTPGGSPQHTITIPTIGITEGDWGKFNTSFIETVSLVVGNFSELSVSDYSGLGPTFDGRIKPDVLAPGENTVSAASDADPTSFNCGLSTKSGTSMATPAVAGASSLIQEYFQKGFYPSGTATPGDSLVASNSLVKALLVGSAVSVEGGIYNGEYIGPAPNGIQGFGRIQLNNVLSFAGDNRITLWVTQQIPITTDEAHSYCFKVNQNTVATSPTNSHQLPSLRATLVWMDFPGGVGTGLALVNNLDLEMNQHGINKVLLGNDISGDNQADTVNNVEQITLFTANASAPYISVVVYGTNVPQGIQTYSLVVNGNASAVGDECCANPSPCQDESSHPPDPTFPASEPDPCWGIILVGKLLSLYSVNDDGQIPYNYTVARRRCELDSDCEGVVGENDGGNTPWIFSLGKGPLYDDSYDPFLSVLYNRSFCPSVTKAPITPATVNITYPATVSSNFQCQPVISGGVGILPGKIHWTVDGADYGVVNLSTTTGKGSLSLGSLHLAGGTHIINCSYLGADGFQQSSGTTVITVQRATVTTSAISTNGTPSNFGDNVLFSATFTWTSSVPAQPTLASKVGFFDGATLIATVNLGTPSGGSATATATVNNLTAGSHTIKAVYLGDGNFVGAQAASPKSVTQVIDQIATVTAITPKHVSDYIGQSDSLFTVTVTPDSGSLTTGSVVFSLDATPQDPSVPVTGLLTFRPQSTLGLGLHKVGVCYTGTSTFASSCDTANLTVVKGTTRTTLTPVHGKVVIGKSLTFTATPATLKGVGSLNGATIQFLLDGVKVGSTISITSTSPSVTFNTPVDLALGLHTVRATLGGLTLFSGSSVTVNFTVESAGEPNFMTYTSPTTRTTGNLLKSSKVNLTYSDNADPLPALYNYGDLTTFGYAPQGDLTTLISSTRINSHGSFTLTFTPVTVAPVLLYLQAVPIGMYTLDQNFILGSCNGKAVQIGKKLSVTKGNFGGVLVFPGGLSSVTWTGPSGSGNTHLAFTLAWIAAPVITWTPTADPIHVTAQSTTTLHLKITLAQSTTKVASGMITAKYKGIVTTVNVLNGVATYVTPKLSAGASSAQLIYNANTLYAASQTYTVKFLAN